MGIMEGIKSKYADYRLTKINKLEESIKEKEGCVIASPASPEKLMSDKLKITLKTLPKQLSIAKNMELTVKSLNNNPEYPKFQADDHFIDNLENYTKSISIDKIGYVKTPSELIFKDKAILYENAIVLLMEMDKESVDAALSEATQEMGVVTYDELGKKTNELTEFLIENGFGAHASHPAGGIVMYPHLAQLAGLGYIGRYGMLITPELGPRQRISVIFTSIKNLSINDFNEHLWIPDFCVKCGKCIKKCPGNAIIEKDNKTKIIKDLCHGCTICMMDCSFNKVGYQKIRSKNH